MLSIERAVVIGKQERRPVQEPHGETDDDRAVDRDGCAARDDDSGQEPQDRGRCRGDAETGQALRAARDLIPPLQSVVPEAERDRAQGTAARLELARITSARR